MGTYRGNNGPWAFNVNRHYSYRYASGTCIGVHLQETYAVLYSKEYLLDIRVSLIGDRC